MNNIKEFFNREQNLLVHIIMTIIVILFSIIFKLSIYEWILVIFMITLVISSELFNSAIELTVDIYTNKFNSLAMIAKDTAAAAVVISALTALFVGIYIFLPKIISLVK